MKRNRPLITLSALLLGCLALIGLEGCAALGPNPTPPSKLESLIYSTVTNYVTVTKTNEVPVAVWSTNQITVTLTNQLNQTITTQSNVVNLVWHTNEVVAQVQQAQYTETVKPSVTSGIGVGSALLNAVFPGAGSLAAPAITALLVGFGWLRSSNKGKKVGLTLAQEVETAREFLQALPNGATYDNAFVNFLQSHQAEAGVAATVIGIVQDKISNPDAKSAAQGVIDEINSLKATSTPIPAVSAAS